MIWWVIDDITRTHTQYVDWRVVDDITHTLTHNMLIGTHEG